MWAVFKSLLKAGRFYVIRHALVAVKKNLKIVMEEPHKRGAYRLSCPIVKKRPWIT